MNEREVLALFETCSNVGRWGDGDELGTLNYVTPDVMRAAAELVRSGRSISLAHQLGVPDGADTGELTMLPAPSEAPFACVDAFTVAPHGYSITHLDALGHVFFDGRAWNGRRAADILSDAGLSFAAITAMSAGIFTRGVLLDICKIRGVPWLDAGEAVSRQDLEAAEVLAANRIRPGDAVFVRTGLAARRLAMGGADAEVAVRTGLGPDCIAFLHERKVAVYSGDCIEQLPSGFDRVPMPLHMIGLVSMGLVLLDNTDVEALATAVLEEERYDFLLTCAPLPITRATGSPVNPIATF